MISQKGPSQGPGEEEEPDSDCPELVNEEEEVQLPKKNPKKPKAKQTEKRSMGKEELEKALTPRPDPTSLYQVSPGFPEPWDAHMRRSQDMPWMSPDEQTEAIQYDLEHANWRMKKAALKKKRKERKAAKKPPILPARPEVPIINVPDEPHEPLDGSTNWRQLLANGSDSILVNDSDSILVHGSVLVHGSDSEETYSEEELPDDEPVVPWPEEMEGEIEYHNWAKRRRVIKGLKKIRMEAFSQPKSQIPPTEKPDEPEVAFLPPPSVVPSQPHEDIYAEQEDRPSREERALLRSLETWQASGSPAEPEVRSMTDMIVTSEPDVMQTTKMTVPAEPQIMPTTDMIVGAKIREIRLATTDLIVPLAPATPTEAGPVLTQPANKPASKPPGPMPWLSPEEQLEAVQSDIDHAERRKKKAAHQAMKKREAEAANKSPILPARPDVPISEKPKVPVGKPSEAEKRREINDRKRAIYHKRKETKLTQQDRELADWDDEEEGPEINFRRHIKLQRGKQPSEQNNIVPQKPILETQETYDLPSIKLAPVFTYPAIWKKERWPVSLGPPPADPAPVGTRLRLEILPDPKGQPVLQSIPADVILAERCILRDLKYECWPVSLQSSILKAKDKETSDILQRITSIAGRPVSITAFEKGAAYRVGVIQGVPLHIDLQPSADDPDQNIFPGQIKNYYRILLLRRIFRNGTPTRAALFHYDGPDLPPVITMHGRDYKTRPFVPEPLRCCQCQRYGHIARRCKNPAKCAVCSEDHDTELCLEKLRDPAQPNPRAKCPNCSKNHHAWNRRCLTRLQMINHLRISKGLPARGRLAPCRNHIRKDQCDSRPSRPSTPETPPASRGASPAPSLTSSPPSSPGSPLATPHLQPHPDQPYQRPPSSAPRLRLSWPIPASVPEPRNTTPPPAATPEPAQVVQPKFLVEPVITALLKAVSVALGLKLTRAQTRKALSAATEFLAAESPETSYLTPGGRHVVFRDTSESPPPEDDYSPPTTRSRHKSCLPVMITID